MNFGRARHLSNVDGDEISPVRRAANKRRFLLRKAEDMELDPEVVDILSIPTPNEGSLLDMIRKDGADETVEEAFTMAARLLAGIGPELSRETVEKLGQQMYSSGNPPLNSSSGEARAQAGDIDETDPSDIDEDDANYDTDSPADLAAVGKRSFSDDERKDLASSGKAEPDGSYPIANKSDLKNAIQAFGRSKNKGKTKAHIVARAKALGATGMLPDGWAVSKADEEVSTTETREGGDPVETHAVPIQKEDGTWDLSGVPAENRPFYEAMIQKAASAEDELEATREALKKADERTTELSDALRTRELVQKAETEYGKIGPADKVAKILKAASEGMDEETYTEFEEVMKSAQAKIDTGDLFTELGRSGTGAPMKTSSAEAEAIAKADELVAKGEATKRDVAIGMVWEQNPGLYDRYMAENQQLWTTTPNPALAAAYQASQGGEQ